MSSPYSKPISFGDSFHTRSDSPAMFNARPFVQPADRVVDAALRSVPLPEGLMRRLGLLLGSMTDDASDSVDYLGC